MKLIVVRHGRTEANARGLLLGRLDVDLDEVGRRQAKELAATVGPVDRVISSPLAPHRLKPNGTAINPPVAFSVRNSTSFGRCPANSLIFGFGSNRSA